MKNLFNGVYEGKRILITGDTGFKGSWLAIWLHELGADVYGYALPPKTERDNFVKCELEKKIHHLDGDIRDLTKLKNYFNDIYPDFAFHLAAQPIVLESYKNPHYTFETNIMGTVNFFEAVKNTSSVKAAVTITSDKCYKNMEWIWGYRENDPFGGEDPYSASKGCSEIVTNSYLSSFFNNQSTCSIASARAGNVIGGGDWAEHRIIPDFFRSVIENQKLIVRNPSATRPWQFVLESLSGYLLLGTELFLKGNEFSGGWNFGPQEIENYKVIDLLDAIIKQYGRGKVVFDNDSSKFHEANQLKLDISKAKEILKWKPVLNFRELVDFTVTGYNAEFSKCDLYKERADQIIKFCIAAKNNKCSWVE